MDEQFQNLLIFGTNSGFSNWKKISKFVNFPIWTVLKHFQFRKFSFQIENPKFNLKNSKNCKLEKFQNFAIEKLQQISNLKY